MKGGLVLMKKNEVLSAISDKLISIKNKAIKEETKDASKNPVTDIGAMSG